MKKITLLNAKKEVDTFTINDKNFLRHIDFIVGISRGGLIPAALLSTKIDKPLVAAYIDKQDNVFIDDYEWIKGKKEVVLIIDDICRSGKTLSKIFNLLKTKPNIKVVYGYTIFTLSEKLDRKYSKIFEDFLFSKRTKEDIIFPWDYDKL